MNINQIKDTLSVLKIWLKKAELTNPSNYKKDKQYIKINNDFETILNEYKNMQNKHIV